VSVPTPTPAEYQPPRVPPPTPIIERPSPSIYKMVRAYKPPDLRGPAREPRTRKRWWATRGRPVLGQFVVEEGTYARILAYAAAERISKAEAQRQLIERGLAAYLSSYSPDYPNSEGPDAQSND
jgi:hypothetical protein